MTLKPLARGALSLVVLVLVLGVLGSRGPARAKAPVRRPLICGVEGESKGVRSTDLCAAIGSALKRTVVVVDDARTSSGEAVQVIRGDVVWTVIWLESGKVRAWTRVSQTEAADQQVRFVVHATRALIKFESPPNQECVRLDVNGGRQMRSTDLTYPWAELKPCKRKSIEVVDPWWLPG